MRRRSARDPDLATGSPALPLALAVAVLAVLGFSRWWVTRPAPPARSTALDAGSYVTAIAPALRRAGCGARACHGGAAPMRLDPAPSHAAAMLAELDAVRPFAGRGDPAESPLWLRATSPAHAGAGAFGLTSCEARALARWVGGAAVRSCAAPLPPPLR
jgi:hypothetical protein